MGREQAGKRTAARKVIRPKERKKVTSARGWRQKERATVTQYED